MNLSTSDNKIAFKAYYDYAKVINSSISEEAAYVTWSNEPPEKKYYFLKIASTLDKVEKDHTNEHISVKKQKYISVSKNNIVSSDGSESISDNEMPKKSRKKRNPIAKRLEDTSNISKRETSHNDNVELSIIDNNFQVYMQLLVQDIEVLKRKIIKLQEIMNVNNSKKRMHMNNVYESILKSSDSLYPSTSVFLSTNEMLSSISEKRDFHWIIYLLIATVMVIQLCMHYYYIKH